MPQTTKQPEILPPETKEPLLPLSELPPKQQILAILKENGVSIVDAAKALDLNYNYACGISSKVSKYDLADSKYVKAAAAAHKKIMRGKAWGDVKDIKASDVNRCIDRVFDRAQPVVRHNVNVNATVIKVDLSKHMD
jgi:hypothetical protein